MCLAWPLATSRPGDRQRAGSGSARAGQRASSCHRGATTVPLARGEPRACLVSILGVAGLGLPVGSLSMLGSRLSGPAQAALRCLRSKWRPPPRDVPVTALWSCELEETQAFFVCC
jgi:hypothetical protein